MNLYNHDLSLLDFDPFNFSDPGDDSLSLRRNSAAFHNSSPLYRYDERDYSLNNGRDRAPPPPPPPPKHRHDGSSPLPFGMDWSPPPRNSEGRYSVWPHDPRTGWSYCVVIASWTIMRKSRSSDPVVFYRVQVGVQSPEGVTTIRTILRRFNDFLNLLSELKKEFPKKGLPAAPPKKVLRIKNQELLDERRCSLEDWMQKLLSDIDLSRCLQVALFLELEAAVRFSFSDIDQQNSDVNSSSSDVIPSMLLRGNSDVSADACSSSITSDHGNEKPRVISELGTSKPCVGSVTDIGSEKLMSEHDLVDSSEINVNLDMWPEARAQTSEANTAKPVRLDGTEFVPELEDFKRRSRSRKLSTESVGSDLSSIRGDTNIPGGSGAPTNIETFIHSDIQFSRALVTLPSDERLRLNRVLQTFKQRLATAKADMEDLIARLNQEVAVRQFLTTKVKDLEVELETTTLNCKENMQQTVLNERERVTQMQWDTEELRRKCIELELKLKSEEEEKVHREATLVSIMHENKTLLEELDVARDKQKQHEDFELKSKTEVKLLIKEVKSLRNSQSELKHELGRLMKDKLDLERVLQKEKQRAEVANTANTKILHECRILIGRLEECSVKFLVEEEDKLIVDTSEPSDAIDLLTTSDNRIGLLLAETQLLAQEVESALMAVDKLDTQNINDDVNNRKSDDELRKMLTDILVDNATLRMQVNSVLRCALKTGADFEDNDEDEEEDDVSLRKTVLSKFLER